MSIEQTIFARLNTSTVTSIASDRIYPTEAKRGTDWPFLVYRLTGRALANTMGGAAGISLYTVQVDCWAKSLAQVTQLSDAVVALLNAYKTAEIKGSFLVDQDTEEGQDDEEGDIYHAVLVFSVWA